MIAEIDDDLLFRAQRRDGDAAAEVYALVLPQMTRLAITLCASERSGKAAVQQVMQRSSRVFERWRDGEEAARWFTHQLILFTRRVPRPKKIEEDIMYANSDALGRTEYRAFLTSIRRASTQQQEAYVLNTTLRWNPRLMAIAMDCSTEAAANHLEALASQLKELSGSAYAELVSIFVRTFRRLPPDSGMTPAALARKLSVRRTTSRVRGVVQFVVMIAIIAASAWFGWQLWPMIRT